MSSSTRRPRPSWASAHSPNTAPITDTVAATFSPLKNEGSAAGSSTRRSVPSREKPRLRISLSCSRSTERRPSSTFTVIGKKHTRATMASLGARPKSKASTNTGASTTTGMACEATSSG